MAKTLYNLINNNLSGVKHDVDEEVKRCLKQCTVHCNDKQYFLSFNTCATTKDSKTASDS